ncbi:MAG: metal-dependent transcriptional regulator [Anaerolineales bacterium]|nr:metal-dependent transcriptional regulator [Anaerolineales bacterium]
MPVEREKYSRAIEDYLKIIFELLEASGRVSTKQIAEALDVKPASVTGMLQKMSAFKPALVNYRKHHSVSLTPEGRDIALRVIRRHRLIERFLQETLGFSWDKVHEEAHRLEHVVSDEFEKRVAEVLGDPEFDPHGSPIPTRELEMPEHSQKPLSELDKRERAYIREVPDEDEGLLLYLEEVGVVPGARIEVLERSPYDGIMTLIVMGQLQNAVLGPSITRRVFVEKKR